MESGYYMSSEEAAVKWGITPRYVQKLIKAGKIPDYTMSGRRYLIPIDSERPDTPGRGHVRGRNKRTQHEGIPRLEEAEYIISSFSRGGGNSGLLLEKTSYHVANCARNIANSCEHMNGDYAYILGLLHNIGYTASETNIASPMEGYRKLTGRAEKQHNDYTVAARVCVTHAFPVFNETDYQKQTGCTEDELGLVKGLLNAQNEYDRLIQFCVGITNITNEVIRVIPLDRQVGRLYLKNELDDFQAKRYMALYEIEKEFTERTRIKRKNRGLYALLPGMPLEVE